MPSVWLMTSPHLAGLTPAKATSRAQQLLVLPKEALRLYHSGWFRGFQLGECVYRKPLGTACITCDEVPLKIPFQPTSRNIANQPALIARLLRRIDIPVAQRLAVERDPADFRRGSGLANVAVKSLDYCRERGHAALLETHGAASCHRGAGKCNGIRPAKLRVYGKQL